MSDRLYTVLLMDKIGLIALQPFSNLEPPQFNPNASQSSDLIPNPLSSTRLDLLPPPFSAVLPLSASVVREANLARCVNSWLGVTPHLPAQQHQDLEQPGMWLSDSSWYSRVMNTDNSR